MTRRKTKEPPLPQGDDGHTIVSMNVEGMPWYRPPGPHEPPPVREREGERQEPQPLLTPRQTRMYTWGAMKAAMLVTLVMCLGLVLFVAFCVFVWFR